MRVAELFLSMLGVYCGLGLVVALAFVTLGVGRVDPGARGFAPLFRLLILPGSVALWPIVVREWFVARRRGAALETAHSTAVVVHPDEVKP